MAKKRNQVWARKGGGYIKLFVCFNMSLETLSSSSLKRYTLTKCEDRELSYWPTVTCFSLIAQISEFPKPESSTKTKGDGKIWGD